MIVKIRLRQYKTTRGRCAGIATIIVAAIAIFTQADGSIVVELMENGGGHTKGHNIAVLRNDVIK